MLSKKNGVTRNNKFYFIAMFVILLMAGITIVVRNGDRAEKIAEERKKMTMLMTSRPTTGAKTTPMPGADTTELTSQQNKGAQEILDDILAKNNSKKKLLFFFGSWNKESLIMLEDLKKMENNLKENIKIIAIEVEGSEADDGFFSGSQMERIKCDDSKISLKYMVDAVPTIVVLEKNNNVLTTKKGSLKYEEILKLTN